MAWRYEIDRYNLQSERILQDIALQPSCARVLQFALSANVVTYVLTGGRFGYWSIFPARDPWIVPPAWGEAELDDGKAVYGLVPIGSHTPLKLEATRSGWREASANREAVDPGYNLYIPATGSARQREDALQFRPLVVLGLVLARWLRDESWFGASRVLVTSASSKTALGYAMQHSDDLPLDALTSARSRAFVEKTGQYRHTFTYVDLPQSNADTLILDFAGDPALIRHLRESHNARVTVVRIGITHANNTLFEDETVFFAPQRIAHEIAGQGFDAFERDRAAAIAEFAEQSSNWFVREYLDGQEAIVGTFRDLLAGRVAPDRLLIARPNGPF